MSSHPSRSRQPCVFLSSGHGTLNQVWMIKALQLELRTFIAGNSKAAEKCSWKKKLLLLLWDLHLLLSSSPAQAEPWDPEKYQALRIYLGGTSLGSTKDYSFLLCKSCKFGGEMFFFLSWGGEVWKKQSQRLNPRTPSDFSILVIPGKGL